MRMTRYDAPASPRWTTLVLAALVIFLAPACGGSDGGGEGGSSEEGGGGGGEPKPADIPDFSGIYGYVEMASGAAVEGATVAASGSTATTDASGYFELELAAAGEVVVRVTADGFLPGIRKVPAGQGKPSAVEFRLVEEAAPLALNADAGGEVTGSRGAFMAAPAGAFVDGTGAAVTGEVQVHLTPLDPSVSDELAAYPGDLSATSQSGEAVQLESFGVLDVTVRQNGQKLEVAPGQELAIRIPAPAGGPTPPDTIPLWSFDEDAGVWVEEGVATLNADTGTYEATIAHMSWWNADQPLSGTCVRGKVVDSTGAGIPGAFIQATGVDYNGNSQATADADGNFCIVVRRNSTVRIAAIHPAGGGEIKEITSGDTISSVPPVCDESCLDAGTFTVNTGVVVGPEGEIDCGGVGNPFANTCASEFGDLGECFRPEGECTISSTGITWENGAKSQFDASAFNPATGSGTGQLIGASGDVCATYTVTGTSSENVTIVYELPNGQSFTFEYDDSGNMVLQCPNGQSVTLTQEQLQVYQACLGGGATEDSQQTCKLDIGGGGGGGGGGIGATCSGDDDCNSGLICCDISGFQICTIAGGCPNN